VGWVTFTEILQERLFYTSLLVAAVLLSVAFFLSQLSFTRPERIIQDFGLSIVTLVCAAMGVLFGSHLIPKECERKTMDVALSRPILRWQFLLGKYFGLMGVIGLNWIILVGVYLGVLWGLFPSEWSGISGILTLALFLGFMQSIVLSSFALCLSTLTTASLSVACCIVCYILGHNISQLRYSVNALQSETWKFYGTHFIECLPNLEYFDLGSRVTYGLPVSLVGACSSIVYGVVWAIIPLIFAGCLIKNSEV
jgi:ABC-type transport system involved in multi-copper enzyme maturation permease subunit